MAKSSVSSSEEEDKSKTSSENNSESESNSNSNSDSSNSDSNSSNSDSDSGSDSDQDQKNRDRERNFDSDSDDEVKRVVVTQEQKRVEKMKEIIKKIKDRIRNDDFVQLYDLYEEFNKEVQVKQKMHFNSDIYLQKMYIYYIWYIEQFCKNFPNDKKKKLSKLNNTSFNTLKQKIKKNKVQYEQMLEECDEDPKEYYDSEKEYEKTMNKIKEEKEQNRTKKVNNNGEGSDSSSSDDEAEVKQQYRAFRRSNDPMKRRKYWIKKEVLFPQYYKKQDQSDDELNEETKQKLKDENQKRILENLKKKEDAQFNVKLDEDKLKVDYKNWEDVQKNIRIIIEQSSIFPILNPKIKRIKHKCETSTKMFYHSVLMNALQSSTKNLDIRAIEIIMVIIPLGIDLAQQLSPTHMPRNIWLQNYSALQLLLNILKSNKKIDELQPQTYYPTITNKEDGTFEELEFETPEEEIAYKFFTKTTLQQQLVTYLLNLESELYKSFKNVEYTTPEYDQRINDLYQFLLLAKQVQEQQASIKNKMNVARIAFKRLENLYYLNDSIIEKIRISAEKSKQEISKDEFFMVKNSEELITQLCNIIYEQYKNNQQEQKTIYQTIIYQMYHHAIHDRTEKSLNIQQISQISKIMGSSSPLYIIWNRYQIQLALSFFRQGKIKESNECFKPIYQKTANLKELTAVLGQVIAKTALPSDRKQALPYHMHISLELVETVNGIVGVLLDTPSLQALDKQNITKNHTFKQFYESFAKDPKFRTVQIRGYSKHQFNGPVESNQEQLFAALKCISKGNWQEANDYLCKLNIWNKLSNSDQTKVLLLEYVKKSALKCYLIFYRATINSLSLNILSDKFQMDLDKIKKVISKLIIKKTIQANLHGTEDNYYLVYELNQRSQIQFIGDKLIEQIQAVTTINEAILNKEDLQEKQQQQQQQQKNNQKTGQKKSHNNNNNNKTYKKK